jgi:hypothetical protein
MMVLWGKRSMKDRLKHLAQKDKSLKIKKPEAQATGFFKS